MVQLVNGKLVEHTCVLDRGFAYGDGLFETMALVKNHIHLWHMHWQRLVRGLVRLDLCKPTQLDSLYDQLLQDLHTAILQWQLSSVSETKDGVIKLVVSRGVGGQGYLPPLTPQLSRIIAISAWPADRVHLAQQGIRIRLCQHAWGSNPTLAGLKHLNRLDQVLARQEWRDQNIHEGLMLNQQGHVQSGVMSNIFVQQGQQLVTPPNDQAGIDGVMAHYVQELAKQAGINVIRQPLSLVNVQQADAVFLTNSLNGIWPVVAWQQRVWHITPLVRELQQALQDNWQRSMMVSEYVESNLS